MKNKYFLFLFLMTLIINSCSNVPKEGKENLDYLYRMRIPESSKVIYHFSYPGEMSFSSNHVGLSIQDSTKIFKKSNITALPSGTIMKVTSDSIIIVSDHETYEKQLIQDGFKIIIQPITYYGAGSSGIHYFKFLEETNDKLTFIDVVHASGKSKGEMTFNKFNALVFEDSIGCIEKIEIIQNELVAEKKSFMRIHYLFFPDSLADNIRVSDYNIFKNIKHAK